MFHKVCSKTSIKQSKVNILYFQFCFYIEHRKFFPIRLVLLLNCSTWFESSVKPSNAHSHRLHL